MQGIHEGPKYLLELGDQRLLWLFFLFLFCLFCLGGGGCFYNSVFDNILQ